ncbi:MULTISPECIES: hypothetical protein [unclassified Microcoleus]|uniref:hypothetical protein n=1 Tax=unclassified Microcoleus TaxID=2642155 RepID=UPI0025F52F4C|nr:MULTISPECIES: hypothetical protein [unclassified Microcoleus]
MNSIIRRLNEVFFARNNWLKASCFEGEIKSRLFINLILFLLGRGRYQTVNCQLSTVNF